MEIKYQIKAHFSEVVCLHYCERLNVLVTADRNTVTLRNLYNLKYLTNINLSLGQDSTVIDVKISTFDLLYILVNLNGGDDSELLLYTVNGVYLNKTTGKINNFDFTTNGRVLVGFYDRNYFSVLDGVNFKKISSKNIHVESPNAYNYFTFEYDNESKMIYSGMNNREGSCIKCVKITNKEEMYFL